MITGTKVISLTRDEVIDQVAVFVEELLRDNLLNFIKGDRDASNIFSAYQSLEDLTNEQLMEKWCDLCSESFFEKNKDVDEVLMDVTLNKGGTVHKHWMASKEDVRVIKDENGKIIME